ncbi:ethanolamine ammonia-lyase subunit EutC [Paraglaciecola sp. 2405UD69-4]|uniref:ethanolamine ammonia-lyase subunit EutC n=1 Tax=Paraglaciecola sp. 2405UD69-4 TaxID=3391836 RepID=UPI0039C9BE0C
MTDKKSHKANALEDIGLSASDLVTDNPWRILQNFTDARIGLGRAGISLPTNELLAFQLAHAQARDAVHLPLNVQTLADDIRSLSLPVVPQSPIILHSLAENRVTYLQRPNLGRRLDEVSQQQIIKLQQSGEVSCKEYDLAIVVVDGLSSCAIQDNAAALINALANELRDDSNRLGQDWRLAPITIVQQGRVAIGDEVASLLNANAVLVLVGERPGLSSPDSIGMYLTWAPKLGLTDVSRNCISNVRPAGMSFMEASHKAMYLLRESRDKKISGVALKDRTNTHDTEQITSSVNFLLAKP